MSVAEDCHEVETLLATRRLARAVARNPAASTEVRQRALHLIEEVAAELARLRDYRHRLGFHREGARAR